MMRGRFAVVAGLAVALAGCTANNAILQKQAETEARVEHLIQGTKESGDKLDALSRALKELQVKVSSQETKISELQAKARGAEAVAQPSPEIPQKTSARIEVIVPEQGEKESSASEAYMRAFGLYSANNFRDAVAAFSEIIRLYPGSDYAGNAQYWIGECYYTESNLPKALEAFRAVASGYPKGKKVPDAMLKAGFTLYAMNEQAEGRAVLEELIRKFPDHQLVAKAKERLRRP